MELNDIQFESREEVLKVIDEIKADKTFISINKYCLKYKLKPAQLIHWLSLTELPNFSRTTFDVYSNTHAIQTIMKSFQKRPFEKDYQCELYDIWLASCFNRYQNNDEGVQCNGKRAASAFDIKGKESNPFKHADEYPMWEHGYLKLPRYDDSTYEAKKKQKERAKRHFIERLEYYVSLLKVELEKAIDQEQIIQIKQRLDKSQKRLQQIRKSA